MIGRRSRTSCRGRRLVMPRRHAAATRRGHFPTVAEQAASRSWSMPTSSRSRAAATIRRPAAVGAAAATRSSSRTRGARRRSGPGFDGRPAFVSLRRRPGCRTRDPTTWQRRAGPIRDVPIGFGSSARPECRAVGLSIPMVSRRTAHPSRGDRRSGREASSASSFSKSPVRRYRRRRRGGSVRRRFRRRSGRSDDRRNDARARLGVATGDERRSVQFRVASPT
jgi:hypothetical protein